jgi:hypothetical protein
MKIEPVGVFIPWTVLIGLPSFVGFGHLLKYTTQGGNHVLAIGLAICAGLLIACLRMRALERARCRFIQRSPSEWKDQQQVGFGARLRADGAQVLSPLSGSPCALAFWQLHVPRRGNPPFLLSQGVLLAASEFDTRQGRIAVRGMPDLCDVEISHCDASRFADLHRLAAYLLSGDVHLPGNGATLSTSSSTAGRTRETARSAPAAGDAPAGGGAVVTSSMPPIAWHALRERVLAGDSEAAIRQLAESLQASRLLVGEATLPVGAEVCVFGTWQASDRVLLFDPQRRGGWQGILAVGESALLERGQRRQRNAGRAAAVLAIVITATLVLIG